MDTLTYIQILVGLLASMFAMLVAVLAWIGSRVHSRLDNLYEVLDEKLGAMDTKLGGIERDLRKDLTGLDRRVTRVEASCRIDQ